MEDVQIYLKLLSYFLWMSLFSVLCIQWCKGLIDGKSMLTFCGMVFSLAIGYSILKGFIQTGQYSPAENFSCINENESYYSCMGWPIMKDNFSVDITNQTEPSILKFAKIIVEKIQYLFTFGTGYAQIIAVIILYSKLTRSLWTYEPKEIIFAFITGGIIYLSLTNAVFLQTSFMNMVMYFFGIENRGSVSGINIISEVSQNLQNWHKNLTDLITIQEDFSLFSTKMISVVFEGLIFITLRFLIMIPLSLFSFLNLIMMVIYQVLLMTLPIDAIKMSMNANVDPLFIVKKIYSLALLSIVVVIEFQILSWIPNAPIVQDLISQNGYSGMMFSLFIPMIGIIFVIILGILFSLSVIIGASFVCMNSIRMMKL